MKLEIAQENGVDVFTYTWQRIREEYRAYTTGEKIPKGTTFRDVLPKWEAGRTFYGSSSEEMRGYLANGYEFDTIAEMPVAKVDAPVVDWRYNDTQGELDLSMAYNGETEYYLEPEVEPVRQGVNLIVGMGFNSVTSAELIGDYSAWIGSVIASLEKAGLSLQITLEYEGQHRYIGRGKCVHRIVVSEFGRTNLDTDWSALFAPGAYRHLGWMAYALPTEDGQATLIDDWGSSTPRGFGVKFDKETRTIRTTVDCNSGQFAADLMNEEYARALDQAVA